MTEKKQAIGKILCWPVEMFGEATNPRFSPSLSNMSNLHGAMSWLPYSALWEILVSAVAAGAVFVISIRSHFLPTFAAGLLGGMPLARLSYGMDLALLIPALLIDFGWAWEWMGRNQLAVPAR